MAVQFKLEAFQGPLDLLLHLISKHKLDICDIEISLLLEQYLAYMDQLDEQDYESAGEFLEMAARLIYIKTVSLLPQQEEAEELKKDLQGQIIEYSICKKAAEHLKDVYIGGSIFVREPAGVIVNKTYTRVHEPDVLYKAYMGISEKKRNNKPLRAEMFSPIVSKKIVSVTSKIIFILKKLYKTGVYNMSGLYDGVTGKSERVATFLAVLELTKSGRIVINADNTEIRFVRKHNRTNSEDMENVVPVVSEDNALQTDVTEQLDDDTPYEEESSVPEVKVSTERVYNERVISYPFHVIRTDAEEHKVADKFETPLETDVGSSDETCAEQDIGGDTLETDVDVHIDLPADELEPVNEITEPPKTVIKLNYWNMRRYFWGNCHVGDDGRNNYWYYG